MSMVSISSQTVKQMRIKRGYSTQEEAVAKTCEVDAKGEGISLRQWSRIEAAKKPLVQVRRNTVELIAKALGVARAEDLGKPPADDADPSKTMQEAGYRRIALWLSKDVRLNYRWVTHQYDVSVQDLIDAAPWMFTLLAEMSLAERARRLKEVSEAFDDVLARLPEHLGHGLVARSDFDHACDNERDSLSSRDVFGKVLTTYDGAVPFDPDETNPFHAFVQQLAATIDTGAIDSEMIEPPFGRLMPRWPVFQEWLDDLTGRDSWALYAAENVKGVLGDLPSDLKGREKTAERIEWLVDQIPPEMRAREEERQAQQAAEWEKMGIDL